MNCFNNRDLDLLQPSFLPLEYNPKKLFPKYKITKPDHSRRYQLKGTRIIISERKIENEYCEYSKKYPWIRIECFELSQPKHKYSCIKIINVNSKSKDKI